MPCCATSAGQTRSGFMTSQGRRAGTIDEQKRLNIRAADDIPAGLRRRLLNAVLDVPMGRDVARLRRCSQNHHPWSRTAVPRPPPGTSRLILESIGRRSMARPPNEEHTPRRLTGLPCAFDQRPASTVITATEESPLPVGRCHQNRRGFPQFGQPNVTVWPRCWRALRLATRGSFDGWL